MPVLDSADVILTVEEIWRIQGRRPDQVRPALRDLMSQALVQGKKLIENRAAMEFYPIAEITADGLVVAGGEKLSSAKLAEGLAGAEQIVLLACTIGPQLDAKVRQLLSSDLALAASLDSVGTIAVDALASHLCWRVKGLAREAGQATTFPYVPGDMDWTLADQETLLALLPAAELGISLSRDHIMTPLKSLTFAIGWGKELGVGDQACEWCHAASRCRHRQMP